MVKVLVEGRVVGACREHVTSWGVEEIALLPAVSPRSIRRDSEILVVSGGGSSSSTYVERREAPWGDLERASERAERRARLRLRVERIGIESRRGERVYTAI